MSAALSETQQSIYDLLQTGKNPDQIAAKLDTTVALVKANMTRIENKGYTLPGGNSVETNKPPVTTTPPKPKEKREFTHDEIRKVVSKLDGTAMTSDQLRDFASKVAGESASEAHPMALLGVTIQYVKLCGGRMSAHQVIEEVYSGLRAFAGVATPDVGGETVKS